MDWTTIAPICCNFDGEFNLRPFFTSWNHFLVVVELCINFVLGFKVQWPIHGCTASFPSPFDNCYFRHSKLMFMASKSHEFQVMVDYVGDIFYFLIVHVADNHNSLKAQNSSHYSYIESFKLLTIHPPYYPPCFFHLWIPHVVDSPLKALQLSIQPPTWVTYIANNH